MKRSEIGGEFWNIPQTEKPPHQGIKLEKSLFPESTSWFLSGRAALSCIIDDIRKTRPFRSVALPSWCCHSMIEPFLQRGVSVRFYPVYPDASGGLVQGLSEVFECDALVLMEYFGYKRSTIFSGFSGITIRDTTHSLFCSPCNDTDYTFGSLRKWAGFWTGGYAWKREGQFAPPNVLSTDEKYVHLRQIAMDEKRAYLQGERKEKKHLQLFAEAEAYLDAGIFAGAAERDVTAAQHIDVDTLRYRRRENAVALLEAMKPYALFPELETEDCPLFVPVLIPNEHRNALRQSLINEEIYCPIHWPISSQHTLTKQTARLYEEELSLVCDQRYDLSDMERFVKVLRKYLP